MCVSPLCVGVQAPVGLSCCCCSLMWGHAPTKPAGDRPEHHPAFAEQFLGAEPQSCLAYWLPKELLVPRDWDSVCSSDLVLRWFRSLDWQMARQRASDRQLDWDWQPDSDRPPDSDREWAPAVVSRRRRGAPQMLPLTE